MACEKYRDFPDPQFNTGIQRSWVYGNENALDVAEKNLNATIAGMGPYSRHTRSEVVMAKYERDHLGPKGADNEASLPLENGEIQFFPKLQFSGAYRHQRTDVNMNRNRQFNYR